MTDATTDLTDLDSRPRRARLAWAVPALAVVAVAGAVTVPMVATASPSLPAKSASQLLVDVSQASGTPLSGTVVETARLGLPALPEVGGAAISPTALLAGSHTARVWYDGADKARVALVGDLAETDLVRNGRDVWLWTSGKNTAQHIVLPAPDPKKQSATPTPSESLTPQAAAQQALAAVDPTTEVRVDGTASVAGRSAYELVLSPRDTRSLVGDVRIAIDSETSVPLRVQVNAAKSSGRPAFETAFTSVTFAKPAAHVFRFAPPPGAKVTGPGSSSSAAPEVPDAAGTPKSDSRPRVIGKGWTAVVELPGMSLPSSDGSRDEGSGSVSETLGALTRAMTPVSGSYGSGRVLRTKLVSVLLLDDGRVFVGAVRPEVLEQAAGS
jgi:outer membrane lipoprotein-sorting protein